MPRISEKHKKPGIGKPGIGLWITVVVASILVYILSSGPTRTLLIQKRKTISVGPHGMSVWLGPTVVVKDGNWKTLYLPLDWAGTQKFGAPLRWYWNLFPIRTTNESR